MPDKDRDIMPRTCDCMLPALSSEWESGIYGQYKHASETDRALNIDGLLFNVSLSLLVRR
jgi:hypothetical protein